MARIRYLKPDFFVDSDLSELSFQHRLIFAGLWCHADKAGRLKYEPKKLKVQIVPYDNIKMELILNDLSKKPFIQIYEVEGVRYIQIVNWDKHQNPHNTEKESIIPPFNGYLTVKEPFLNVGHTISSNISSHSNSNSTRVLKFDFEPLWNQYPNKLGKKEAERHFRASVLTDQDYQDIQKALGNYVEKTKTTEAKYIKHGSTWFNNWKDWISYEEPKAEVDLEKLRKKHGLA
jgi:hypothetical protein